MLHNKVGEQNWYRLFGRSSLLIILNALFSILSAESFSEFKKSQLDSFANYKNENDKTFHAYLKSNWEAYNSKETPPLYELPKPTVIVPKRAEKIKAMGPRIHLKIAPKKEEKQKQKEKTIEKDVNFDFFGSRLGFDIPYRLNEAKFYPQTQKGISNFFHIIVSTNYEDLVEDIKNTITKLGLNDWATYLLVENIANNVFESQDDSRLLSWMVFNKLGYSVRVGLANRHVILLHHSKKIIYDTPSYTIGEKKFYNIAAYTKGRSARLYTYAQDYPESTKAFDLALVKLPLLSKNIKTKNLSFKQHGKTNGKTFSIKYKYNQNLIDFMATYPQADYETYFNAPLDTQTYREIASELRKYINAKKSSVGINFVLNFVQNAFIYEVDAKQFGREKVMFAQETLFYDKSDCEDRAVLFAGLVKELFQIGVVGVKYKDHMATALYIPMKGDSVRVNGRRFVIADPTYINANIGQSMKRYKSKKPKSFIYLNKKKD